MRMRMLMLITLLRNMHHHMQFFQIELIAVFLLGIRLGIRLGDLRPVDLRPVDLNSLQCEIKIPGMGFLAEVRMHRPSGHRGVTFA